MLLVGRLAVGRGGGGGGLVAAAVHKAASAASEGPTRSDDHCDHAVCEQKQDRTTDADGQTEPAAHHRSPSIVRASVPLALHQCINDSAPNGKKEGVSVHLCLRDRRPRPIALHRSFARENPPAEEESECE